MQIRWSPSAAEDLLRIVEYIRKENAPAAQRVAKTVYDRALTSAGGNLPLRFQS